MQQPNTGSDNTTSLRQLVNRLVSESPIHSNIKKSLISNEVSDEIRMIMDESKVTPVISELLTTVVANAKNGDIHISAERYKDVIILQIQERNNYNGYALACSIRSIEPDAHRLGGYINMQGQQKLVTTISFGFPGQLAASLYEC